MNLILVKIRKPREVSEFEELQKQKALAVEENYSTVGIY